MLGGCCGRDRADGRATRGSRGSLLVFVTKQETATAAMASIEDAAECGERADALVSAALGRVMRQRRSIAAAMDYVKALSRGTRANCWELAEEAGHEGPHRMQALLRRYKWARDPQRRGKVRIPEDLKFATKPELAIAQLKRLMAAGVHAMWAAADEVYGRCGEFREAYRALNLAYVVIIPCDYRVTLAKDTVIRADQAIADAFERRSCGNGTKGPRYSDWALIATAGPR